MNRCYRYATGYLKTMLFAIEQRPKFQLHQRLFIFPHLLTNIQLGSMIIDTFIDRTYNDFKLDYLVRLSNKSLLYSMISELADQQITTIILATICASQILLVFYLFFATVLTQFWENNKEKRQKLERQIFIINTILHWYFTFYTLIFMVIVTISMSAITCSHRGLFEDAQFCAEQSTLFLSYITLIIAYIHSILIIYLHRNHRFSENNSLKRRFAYVQILNQTIAMAIVIFHFRQDLIYADQIKYILANIYGIGTVLDQFLSCPYRDPFRIPSIQVAFSFQWITLIATIYKFTNLISDEAMFYWVCIPELLLIALSQVIVQVFHEYALLNYNTGQGITEKYLLLSVDQLYQYYTNYQHSDISKIGYFQLLINHKTRCSNSKCYTKRKQFWEVDFNDKLQLHKFTLNIIKCIFQTASIYIKNQASSDNIMFEQLQLQYISYLSEIVMKPLLGYIELRSNQNINQNNNSIYFQELTSKLAESLEAQILDHQNRMIRQTQLIVNQTSVLQEFSLSQIWKSVNLYQYFLPRFIEIMEMKIQFWQQLLDGYPNLNPYMDSTINLCNKVRQIHDKIDKMIGIPDKYFTMNDSKGLNNGNENINIMNLKLYSIYYSSIVNDYDRAIYSEKYINELIKDDRQKQSDTIDDQSLLQDDAVIILVSMVKNKGAIINKNLLPLCNFFKYKDVREFKEKTLISKLLPQDMQGFHDLLLTNFLQRGFTQYFIKKIHSYYVEQDGFIMPGYIKFGNLFEDEEDYILTASILKTNVEDDIIMFDSEGKIIGISKSLYINHLQRYSPNLTLEILQEKGYIFLFFPQILSLIYQHQHVIQDLNVKFINDQAFLFYINDNLQEMFGDFSTTQYKTQMKDSSMNISSWRSKMSNRVINEALSLRLSQRLSEVAEANNGKILGVSIPLLNHDKSNVYLDYLGHYFKEKADHSVIRVKLSMEYRSLVVKDRYYPYFLMEVQYLNTYEQVVVNSKRLLNLEKQIFQIKQAICGKQKSLNSKFDGVILTEQQVSNTQESLWDRFREIQSEDKEREKSIENDEKQKTIERDVTKQDDTIQMDLSQNIEYFDKKLVEDSQIMVSKVQENKDEQFKENLDVSQFKPIMINPHIDSNIFEDDNEIGFIQKEFNKLEQNEIIEEIEKDLQDRIEEDKKINENENENEIDIDNLDNEDAMKSSTIKNNNKNKECKDVLLVLQQNKMNLEHHDNDFQQKQSSQATSNKTTSSKSPFLLIRNLYTETQFTGNVIILSTTNLIVLVTLFILLFIKLTLVQSNYEILQKNLNYVQYPETLNYYFAKISMLSWTIMEQDIGLIKYSPFINQQIKQELQLMRTNIDTQMMKLYQDIISYENEVLKDKTLPFQIINNLYSFKQKLDLTLVVEQFTSHSLSFIDQNEENNIDQTTVSDILFFRLNFPSINEFCKIFVTFLNSNLVYYEDQIISAVSLIVVSEIGFITLILLYQVRLWQRIHIYIEKVLVLTTRLHQDQALQMIQKYRQIKEILSELNQREWKKVNYSQIIYDQKTTVRVQQTDNNQGSMSSNQPNKCMQIYYLIQQQKINQKVDRYKIVH